MSERNDLLILNDKDYKTLQDYKNRIERNLDVFVFGKLTAEEQREAMKYREPEIKSIKIDPTVGKSFKEIING